MATLSMAASPMSPPLDPTQGLSAASARSNLIFLFGTVAQALAKVELRRWMDGCLNIFMHNDWIQLLQSWPIFLLLIPALLSILSQMFVMASRRFFMARRGSEVDASFPRARSPHRRPHRSQTDIRERLTQRLLDLQKARALEELVAARVIQRWFRATFQPWVLARRGRGSRPASRVAEWTARDTGALVVTHVEDHDFVWTIEQSDELSLLDVSVDDRVYEGTGVDGTNIRGSLRCREAATISSTHILPSRNHVDKFIA